VTPAERLAELGIELPQPSVALANYVPAVRVGTLLFLSGHVSRRHGGVVRGKVGVELSAAQGAELARSIAIDLLATAHAAIGSVDDIKQIVKLAGFVASAPGFTDQPVVINGASDLFVEVFGEAGRHARSAVGVAELPLGAAVEIDGIFLIR
jgi:enamine deaminase RidA (YjgF/YER057c/UK114 family)